MSNLTLINARAEIISTDGHILSGDNIVSTGSDLRIYSTVDDTLIGSYKIILFGDVTGDGIINSRDFLLVKRHVWNLSLLEGSFLVAGSVYSNDKSTAINVNSKDFLIVKRHVWNISRISQSY